MSDAGPLVTGGLGAFLEEVAGLAPTPAAGSVAASLAAMAAALVDKALQIGPADPRRADLRPRIATLRAHTTALIDADAQAYAPVLGALRLPVTDPGRAHALHEAISAADAVLDEIAQAAGDIAEIAEQAAGVVRPLLRADVVAARRCALAALGMCQDLREGNSSTERSAH